MAGAKTAGSVSVSRTTEIITKDRLEYSTETWTLDGIIHREDGPAMTKYINGEISIQLWYRHGKVHREDGPAITQYLNGIKAYECWCINDIRHNDNGPTELRYSRKTGKLREQIWRKNGKLGGNVLAYAWLANVDNFKEWSIDDRVIESIDEFRDTVKGPLALEIMRILPLPISQAIYEYYCMQ